MNANELNVVLTRLGLSKTDLATIAGVTPRQVNSWGRGAHAIPRSVALILGALDNKQISIDWIVDFVEHEMRKEHTHQ